MPGASGMRLGSRLGRTMRIGTSVLMRAQREKTRDGRRAWPYARRAGGLAVCVLACAGSLVMWCGSASALSQRGHELGFSFGSAGEGAGEFAFDASAPPGIGAGVAVDEASGEVYVVDPGNHRVDEFSASGVFLRAWGWGVADGSAEFEVCESTCRAGLSGTGKGELKEPALVAVDNSAGGTGTVYVDGNVGSREPDVQRFSSDGHTALGRLAVEEEGELDGLAVDSSGTVWLYRAEEEESGVIEGFAGSRLVRLEGTLGAAFECPKPGFGVDASGERFALAHELLDAGGECPSVVERERQEAGDGANGGLLRPVVVGEQQGEEAVFSELARQTTTGVAVDEASSAGSPLGTAADGDVYVDTGSAIDVFDPSGGLVQMFGEGEIKQGEGIALDSKTGDVYVVDGGEESVHVFEPEPTGPPVVSNASALDLSPSEVQLSGVINPRGLDTHFFFQYGTADCAANPQACSEVPAEPGTDIGAGFGDQPVQVTLSGLSAATVYHYRLVAENSSGMAEASAQQESFQTLPSSTGLLADGRAWELVSPAAKDGSGIEPFEREGGLIQAAAEGGAVAYVANGPVAGAPPGNRSPEPTQVLSVRSATGWGSQDLMTPHEAGEGLEFGQPAEFRFFSEDDALSLVEPPGGHVQPMERPPLAPGASEKTLYVRADAPLSTSGPEDVRYSEARANAGFSGPGFAALVAPGIVSSGVSFGGKLDFLDATPGLETVVFESEVGLLSGWSAGLWESQPGGRISLVSVLPDGEPAVSPALGNEDTNMRGAISATGSRVVFTSEGSEGAQKGLFLRDTSKGETVQLNAAQGVAEPTEEESEVDFEAATPDGSRVFFTDTAPLVPESGQRQQHEADLYECVIVERAGRLACELTDLTPASGGSADVLNVIPGVSEDGQSAYFVANGVLAPGAVPGQCVHQSQETPPSGASCNLYEWHEGVIRFIASLSNEDSGDWGSLLGPGRVGDLIENRPDLADVTSSVSPNGRFLAFMSSEPLTGYENTDANNPAARDEEVYLYDSTTGLLSCVSCNPNGRSTGTHDVELSGEGVGLLVDRRGDWVGSYLAGSIPGWDPLGLDGALHQPRYLTDQGRLFFNSPDPLVPQATNGEMDVFEYEPDTVGSCNRDEGCVSLVSSGSSGQESAFLDASQSGDEAFFITDQPLVAADRDTNYDLYDARVCTTTSPCLTGEESSQRPCETTSNCKPPLTSPVGFDPPATATITGTGNITSASTVPHGEVKGTTTVRKVSPRRLTRAQLLARALTACRTRHKHSHPKRLACERQARERYPHAHKSGRAHGSERSRA